MKDFLIFFVALCVVLTTMLNVAFTMAPRTMTELVMALIAA